MLNSILIGIGILIAVVILLGIIAMYYIKPNENLVLSFIKKNPQRAAIKLIRNNVLIAARNPKKLMPLASTVKIILAIEYAEQAAEEKINPKEKIPLSALDKFYVEKTDGGAHIDWLKSVKDKISDDRISIREIAKGMIKYSSNANTEWLSQKLGLVNINNRLRSLGIVDHSAIYYIVSALFVGKEKFPTLKGKALENSLKALSIEEYIAVTNEVHHKLSKDLTYKKELGDMGMEIQRIWSDNLPNSTVEEYVGIMGKINSRTYFSPLVQQYLDEIMEFLLESPMNREWLEHTGMKGGSTAFVLTKSLYATDKEGNKTALAYFFNDLGTFESLRLEISMNRFDLKILKNQEFRNKVKMELRLH